MSAADEATTFAITGAKLHVPVVTLSADDNAKLLQRMISESECAVNWNKYQSNVTIQALKQYLDYLINPSVQEVNRLFVF